MQISHQRRAGFQPPQHSLLTTLLAEIASLQRHLCGPFISSSAPMGAFTPAAPIIHNKDFLYIKTAKAVDTRAHINQLN